VRFDESALQLVALMPDQQTLLCFDLIFGPDDHVFTVMAHFDNWIAILEGLNALPGYSRILSGHGEPTVHSAIGATIVYLRKAREVHAATGNPAEYASRLKAIFHNRQNPGWVDISASLLYEVVDAYVTAILGAPRILRQTPAKCSSRIQLVHAEEAAGSVHTRLGSQLVERARSWNWATEYL
jgi:hypothetical protein